MLPIFVPRIAEALLRAWDWLPVDAANEARNPATSAASETLVDHEVGIALEMTVLAVHTRMCMQASPAQDVTSELHWR